MKKNIKFINCDTTYIDETVIIGDNVTVYGNNYIMGTTVIGDNCIIYPNNFIENTVIKNNVKIHNSVCHDSMIDENCNVGPYSRLRPGTKVGKSCKIGNFVEIKNSTIGHNTKVSHLAYIGDAEIGDNCNIGCGVIFANYDGTNKHRTIVGNDVFIGSNSNLIAPVKIADHSYICAGTNLTKDTDEYDFVIGRVRETIKKNYARKYKDKRKN